MTLQMTLKDLEGLRSLSQNGASQIRVFKFLYLLDLNLSTVNQENTQTQLLRKSLTEGVSNRQIEV